METPIIFVAVCATKGVITSPEAQNKHLLGISEVLEEFASAQTLFALII